MTNTIKFTRKLIMALLIMASLFSCSNDEDCCITPITPAGDVWIVNEGNFNQGNSSLVVYDRKMMIADTSVFQLRNNRGLGDIFQSVTFYENKAYLIVNNSQRIEVINTDDFSSIKTMTTNIYSPRYAVIIDDQMYVSDISKPYVYVINTTTDKVVDSIFTNRPVEEMVLHDKLIFGSGSDFYTPVEDIVVIDPNQKSVINNIPVGKNPNAMIKDAEDMIWVMCEGVFGEDNSEGLYRIDASARAVDKSMMFSSFKPQFPTRLAVNTSDRSKIYINGPLGIYQLDMHATSLPAVPHINYSGSIYAIGIDSGNGDFYIGDAAGFAKKGTINVYSATNDLIHSFTAGIGPNRFYFR